MILIHPFSKCQKNNKLILRKSRLTSRLFCFKNYTFYKPRLQKFVVSTNHADLLQA